MSKTTPDQSIEEAFVPGLREPLPQLASTATLADLIDHVNKMTAILNQSVSDQIGDE